MISRINYYVMFCFSAVHIPYILCDSGLGVLSERYRSQPISHGQPSSVWTALYLIKLCPDYALAIQPRNITGQFGFTESLRKTR